MKEALKFTEIWWLKVNMINIQILEKLPEGIFYCRIMGIRFLSGVLKLGKNEQENRRIGDEENRERRE